jgi:hydroxyacylglutathione hydrolase
MISVKRFYDPTLAQASHLIGCTDTHRAIVIDANRDIDQYVRAAAAEGLTITHVTETHIHADYVSGSRELAAHTGAQLYLSDEGGAAWKYAFAADAGAMLLTDGDVIEVGAVRIEAMHTPGHTPEHLIFLVTDTAVSDEPLAAVTGDFLFVGDVGRPDLLERAAKVANSMDGAARQLFASLKRLEPLPDHLQIWPGHGAGSACGKAIGALPQSTLGYERRTNWALQPMPEDAFVRRVLQGQPDAPAYFAEMKRVNKEGPRLLGTWHHPKRLTVAQFEARLAAGAVIVDTRPAAEYGAAHIRGTINIPLNRAFTTWAGWLVPYTREFYLIVDERCGQCLMDAVRDLAMIGLDQLAGYAGMEVLGAWQATGRQVGRIAQIDATTVARNLALGSMDVLDVRSRQEFDAGHVPGARHVPLGELQTSVTTVSKDRPLAVHCQGGTRSAIAASLLDAQGFAPVVNLAGGFSEWQAAGLPVEQTAAAPSVHS